MYNKDNKERKKIMINKFSRTELLIGKEKMEKLAKSRVAIFGVGGVGGYVVEALARSGVGTLDLIDAMLILQFEAGLIQSFS